MIMRFAIVSLLISQHMCGVSAQNCPAGWIDNYEACFFFDAVNLFTRNQARQECHLRLDTADLMYVMDKEEEAWIFNQIATYNTDGWWTSLSKLDQLQTGRDTWMWRIGLATAMPRTMIWATEPDGGTKQNCVAVDFAGQYATEPCDMKFAFICYRYLERPNYCPSTAGWNAVDNTCLYISDARGASSWLSWDNAKMFCQGIYSDLLYVENAYVKQFLEKNLNALSNMDIPWWTGLNDVSSEGQYVWTHGSTPLNTSLVSWLNSPQLNSPDKIYGALFAGGVYRDMSSTRRAHYICKSDNTNRYRSDYDCGKWTQGASQCYYFARGSQYNWADARKQCQNSGADLLSVNDRAEKDFIELQLAYIQPGLFWTGMNDLATEGVYTWVAEGTEIDPSLVPWAKEPNSMAGRENCAEMFNTGALNDNACNHKTGYICESSLNEAINRTCATNWLMYNDSCYYISAHNENQTFTHSEAIDRCVDISGKGTTKLLIIESRDEQSWIGQRVMTMEVYPLSWWTGFVDPSGTGIWKTDYSGQYDANMAVLTWSSEPNDNNNEDCAFIYSYGVYYDVSCETKLEFICEKPVDGGNRRLSPAIMSVVLCVAVYKLV